MSKKVDAVLANAEEEIFVAQGDKIGKLQNLRCELISGNDISYLEGKLKTFLESLGLPDKQEKASKDIIQVMLWDWFNFITDHITDHLSEKKKWYNETGKKKDK